MKIKTNEETIKEIKQIVADYPDEGNMVRVYLAGFGWSGPSFGLALDEQKDNDMIYEEDGQAFLMERDIYNQFGDFLIEYSNGGYLVQPVELQGDSPCSSCTSCG